MVWLDAYEMAVPQKGEQKAMKMGGVGGTLDPLQTGLAAD